MPKSKKPAPVSGSTLLATKGQPAGTALQRGQAMNETLVDLNFKVPEDFRERFRCAAFDARLKNVQLLVRAFEAWEREVGDLPPRRRALGR
jgi:hypothetical protein